MKRKILCLIVSAAVALAMLPAFAFAAGNSGSQGSGALKVVQNSSEHPWAQKAETDRYGVKDTGTCPVYIKDFTAEYKSPGYATLGVELSDKLPSGYHLSMSVDGSGWIYNIAKGSDIYSNYGGDVSIPYKNAAIDIFVRVEANDMSSVCEAKSATVTAKTLSTPACHATKISAKKVSITWQLVDYAKGYVIYKNGKKIKTTANNTTNHFNYVGRGAGKARYKVTAYLYLPFNKTTYYSAFSPLVKANSNKVSQYVNLNVRGREYQTCDFEVKSVSLAGKTYTVTGYALNCRIFKAVKYSKLKIKLYSGNKVIAKKTFKNVKLNIKEYGKKKLTLKIRGKAGVDLPITRLYYSNSWKTIWNM